MNTLSAHRRVAMQSVEIDGRKTRKSQNQKLTREDVVGLRFGQITIIDVVEPEKRPLKCLCKCGCGNEFTTRYDSLQSANTKSCGCLVSKGNFKHGKTNTKTHRIWKHMKNRCYNTRSPDYPEWGGRGIVICERWKNSFEEFLGDLGECPPDHSIERIDVNGNYEPSNCKWLPMRLQSYNRRVSRRFTFDGVTKTLSEWADEYQICKQVVWARIRYGWPDEKLFTTKVRKMSPRRLPIDPSLSACHEDGVN